MSQEKNSIFRFPGYHDLYPAPYFSLPIEFVEIYDDPTLDLGDCGWSLEGIIEDIRKNGLLEPIEVGRIGFEKEIYAFNGNHRLQACRTLGYKMILCQNSDNSHTEPLSLKEIEILGGFEVSLVDKINSSEYTIKR